MLRREEWEKNKQGFRTYAEYVAAYISAKRSGGGTVPGSEPMGGVGYVWLGEKYSKRALPLIEAERLITTDDNALRNWMRTLSRYTDEPVTPQRARAMWLNSIEEAAAWYNGETTRNKVGVEDALAWNFTAKKTGPKKPSATRQVYMSDPATVRELIDTTVTNTLGRKATKAEMDDFYGAVQKMMQEGTVTTTKTRTRNGIPETVVTTTPGYSQQKAEQMIEQRLKTQSPQDYAEKKSLDFLDFLFGGGQ